MLQHILAVITASVSLAGCNAANNQVSSQAVKRPLTEGSTSGDQTASVRPQRQATSPKSAAPLPETLGRDGKPPTESSVISVEFVFAKAATTLVAHF